MTQTAGDLISAPEAAADAAEARLGRPLVEDCADPATAEITPPVARHEIPSGPHPADRATDSTDEHNTTRPHETPARQRPFDIYPTDPTPKPTPPKPEQKT